MIQQTRICDICHELANIEVRALGDAMIKMNTHDGHGDYAWNVHGGQHADLCQKHKDDAFKLLGKLLGDPDAEKASA